jgi:ADP-ribose pyrophosphatase
MQQMQVHDTKIIHSTRFMSFNSTRYSDRNGVMKEWSWAQRPNGIRAVVVAATLEKKLVLIKEFRVPLNGYIYELPAGLVDAGESPETAARREFHEETGLTITKLIRPVSPAIINSPGLSDEAIHMVFAEASGTVDTSKNEGSEDIEVLVYSRAAVQQLLEDAMNDTTIMIGAKAYFVFNKFSMFEAV